MTEWSFSNHKDNNFQFHHHFTIFPPSLTHLQLNLPISNSRGKWKIIWNNKKFKITDSERLRMKSKGNGIEFEIHNGEFKITWVKINGVQLYYLFLWDGNEMKQTVTVVCYDRHTCTYPWVFSICVNCVSSSREKWNSLDFVSALLSTCSDVLVSAFLSLPLSNKSFKNNSRNKWWWQNIFEAMDHPKMIQNDASIQLFKFCSRPSGPSSPLECRNSLTYSKINNYKLKGTQEKTTCMYVRCFQ